MWGYSLALYSVPLISVPVFVSIWYVFDYYSFVVYCDQRACWNHLDRLARAPGACQTAACVLGLRVSLCSRSLRAKSSYLNPSRCPIFKPCWFLKPDVMSAHLLSACLQGWGAQCGTQTPHSLEQTPICMTSPPACGLLHQGCGSWLDCVSLPPTNLNVCGGSGVVGRWYMCFSLHS